MGRPSGRRGKGGTAKSGKGGEEAKDSKYIKRVDLYKFLAKWTLRSYPDERGNPLMLGSGRTTTQAALMPEALRAELDADCCELLRRPTMGVNLAAAAVDCAAMFAPALQEKLETLLPKLGAESFQENVQFLNLARNVERSPEKAPEQCHGFLKKIRRMVREQGEDIAAAAEAAAALYLGLMSILEAAAVSQDFQSWAKGVPERKKQSKHLQAWLQDPKNEDKFLAAMAKSIKEDAKNESRARRFGDLLTEPQDDSSSSPQVASTPSNSDSGSSSPPRKKTKKRAKGSKKAKKNKGEKKQKKNQASSQSSSQEEESEPPAKKKKQKKKQKRTCSAGAASPKSKKAKKASPTPSEGDSSEQAPAKPATTTENDLLKLWPLSELQAFEEKAAQQATAAGAAGLEVEQRLALTKELPVEIQKLVWQRAGLLPTTQDDAVLQANAEGLLKHTVEMVKEVRLAWVQAAIHEDQQKQKNITLLSEDDFFKKLKPTAFPEEEQTAWNAALKGDSPDCRRARNKLLKQGWALEAVVENYNFALEFGTKHAKKEPKKEEILKLLQQIPSPLREAWGLPGEQKFQKQKPAGWKTYCSVAYTLAWQIFKAHVDESVDE